MDPLDNLWKLHLTPVPPALIAIGSIRAMPVTNADIYFAGSATRSDEVIALVFAMPRKSISTYPSNWAEIANKVKEAADWKCISCGHPHDISAGYMLTVHHLDLDPQNCEWWNLVALCQGYHLHIQSKVIMERYWMFEHSEWIKPYVAGYYAHMHGHPTDRDYVMNNLDMLLNYGKPNYSTLLSK
jgi:hypothetical protein